MYVQYISVGESRKIFMKREMKKGSVCCLFNQLCEVT